LSIITVKTVKHVGMSAIALCWPMQTGQHIYYSNLLSVVHSHCC